MLVILIIFNKYSIFSLLIIVMFYNVAINYEVVNTWITFNSSEQFSKYSVWWQRDLA